MGKKLTRTTALASADKVGRIQQARERIAVAGLEKAKLALEEARWKLASIEGIRKDTPGAVSEQAYVHAKIDLGTCEWDVAEAEAKLELVKLGVTE